MFKTNYSEVSEGNVLLPEGNYEVIFKYVGESSTANNFPCVDITMHVRNDVEQKYKNKPIFDNLYLVKEPSAADKECGGFSFKRIQSISKASGIPNGKEYANIGEWCSEFANRCVQVVIKHEINNKGIVKAKVKFYNETRFPINNHVWKNPDEEEVYITGEESVVLTPAVAAKAVVDEDPFND